MFLRKRSIFVKTNTECGCYSIISISPENMSSSIIISVLGSQEYYTVPLWLKLLFTKANNRMFVGACKVHNPNWNWQVCVMSTTNCSVVQLIGSEFLVFVDGWYNFSMKTKVVFLVNTNLFLSDEMYYL